MPEFEGKDHIHPFVSSSKLLEIFKQLGFISEDPK
jgi:hypothetical protein